MTTLERNRTYPLLSVGTDAKTVKGKILNILTGILYLAPHKEAGLGNFCANASKGCIKLCLFTAGRGRFPNVVLGRMRKTAFLKSDPKGFRARLRSDLRLLERKAMRTAQKPAARLDGTTDIQLALQYCKDFPNVQFYDYTKNPIVMKRFLDGKYPANYHLTFSRSEENYRTAGAMLKRGAGVAYIFDEIPETYRGWKVIPADEFDARFLDREYYNIPENTGYIVGLTPKGKAKKDISGMVVKIRR